MQHNRKNTKGDEYCCKALYKADLHWTLEQWKRLLWSDESRFTIWQSDRRIGVWRIPEERYLL
jgi:hypothetical protein